MLSHLETALTQEEKLILAQGISLEAALILKKVFPNEPVLDTLIMLKQALG
jgi:hypothetical protein